jgi:transcriptional regulator with XRE-family HTH domain
MHVTDDWIKERAGVHRSTIARWRNARRFPPALARLAELELAGRVELIHEAWTGFAIDPRSGELVMPGGERYRVGELLALPIRAQLLHELERRLRRGGLRNAIARFWGMLRARPTRDRGA